MLKKHDISFRVMCSCFYALKNQRYLQINLLWLFDKLSISKFKVNLAPIFYSTEIFGLVTLKRVRKCIVIVSNRTLDPFISRSFLLFVFIFLTNLSPS